MKTKGKEEKEMVKQKGQCWVFAIRAKGGVRKVVIGSWDSDPSRAGGKTVDFAL